MIMATWRGGGRSQTEASSSSEKNVLLEEQHSNDTVP